MRLNRSFHRLNRRSHRFLLVLAPLVVVTTLAGAGTAVATPNDASQQAPRGNPFSTARLPNPGIVFRGGPELPVPKVSVSPRTNLTPGQAVTVTATNFPVPSPFSSNIACWETDRGPDFPGDAIFYSDQATREGFGVTNGFHFGNPAPFTVTVNNNGLATITCTQHVSKYGPTPSGGVCPLSAQQLAAGDRCAFSLGVSDGTVDGTVVRSEAITLK